MRIRLDASADLAWEFLWTVGTYNFHYERSRIGEQDSSRLAVTKCEGEALALVSLVPESHGFEAWRVLKDEYEGKGGNRMAALLRGILNPRARWENMHSEGRDLGEILASCEKDVTQYRVAAGTALDQAVQVSTVMEHAPAAYRDLLKVVPLANRESSPALRTHEREGHCRCTSCKCKESKAKTRKEKVDSELNKLKK